MMIHRRNWASTIQARYQMFSPEVIRPSKRIYVGGLPPNTLDVRALAIGVRALESITDDTHADHTG